MKRMTRTLTAAALSGALALGGTAVASAQIPAPAEFELDGVTYQKQADGKYKSTNPLGATTLTADQAQAAWERLQEQQAGEEQPSWCCAHKRRVRRWKRSTMTMATVRSARARPTQMPRPPSGVAKPSAMHKGKPTSQ